MKKNDVHDTAKFENPSGVPPFSYKEEKIEESREKEPTPQQREQLHLHEKQHAFNEPPKDKIDESNYQVTPPSPTHKRDKEGIM